MDTNRLGLGLVFSVLDRGLKKSTKEVRDELDETTDSLNKTDKASMGRGGRGFMHSMVEGMKLLSLSKIGGMLHDIRDGVSGSDTGISELAKNIDNMGAKLNAALDPRTAASFNGSITSLVGSFGVTGDQAETIANALVNAGAPLSEMQKTVPMIGTLVGKLGMSAEKVATSFSTAVGTLGMAPSAVTDMTKEIVRFQREYKITGLVEELPEFIENAYTNLIKFGKIDKDVAQRTVQSTAKMAAGFQKIGFSAQQASKMAMGFNDTITDVREAFLDMQAGLEPKSDVINGLYDAFGAGGLNATDLINSMKSGTMKQEDIMKQMQDMVGSIADPTQKNNAMQRLKRLLGPEMAAALDPLAKKMQDVNKDADAIGKDVTADKAFDQLSKAMGGTLGYSERLRDTNKELFAAMKDLANKSGLITGMNNQTKAFGEFGKEVTDSNSLLGRFILLMDKFKKVGISFLGPDFAKFQIFTGILSDMLFPLMSIVGVFKLLAGPLGFIKKMVSGTFVSLFGKLLPKAMGKFGASATAWLGGPIVGAIVTIISTLWTLIELWPMLTDMVRKVSPEIADIMDGIADFVGDAWDTIKEYGKTALDFVLQTWEDFQPELSDIFDGAMKAASTAFFIIKSIAVAAYEFIVAGWSPFLPLIKAIFKQTVKSVVMAFDIISATISAFFSFYQAGWELFGPMIKDILAFTVKSIIYAYTLIKNAADVVFSGFNDVVTWVMKKWTDFMAWLQTSAIDPLKKIGSQIKEALGIGGESNVWDDMLVKPFEKARAMILDKVKDLGAQISKAIGIDKDSTFGKIVSGVGGFFSGADEEAKKKSDDLNARLGLTGGNPASQGPMAAPGMTTAGATMPGGKPDLTLLKGGLEDDEVAKPVKASASKKQAGAMAAAANAGVDLAPTQRATLSDKNLDAILQAIVDEKEAVTKLLAAILDKDSSVTITGDLKKFMRAAGAATSNELGNKGMNTAYAGNGSKT